MFKCQWDREKTDKLARRWEEAKNGPLSQTNNSTCDSNISPGLHSGLPSHTWMEIFQKQHKTKIKTQWFFFSPWPCLTFLHLNESSNFSGRPSSQSDSIWRWSLRNILGFDEGVRVGPLRYHCIALVLSTLDALSEQRPPWQIARRHHLQAPKQTLTGAQTSGTILDFHNCKIKMSVI